MDLKTTYLGMKLENPLVVGASPMVDDMGMVRRLEDAGASAIVMHSLFEEQITGEKFATIYHMELYADSYSEALSYFPRGDEFALGPDQYLEQIRRIKAAVSIPVIGSLNGTTPGGFTDFAKQIEQAGADALELNLYSVAADPEECAADSEQRMIDLVKGVTHAIEIPVAVKISPFFTALANFAYRLEEVGAEGLVMFNRFYQPDINIEALEVKPTIQLSDPSELLLRLRWTSILSRRVGMDLAVTGGVHSHREVIKSMMAGASVVQLVSALLRHGPEHLKRVREDLVNWMDEFGYSTLGQMKGSMGLDRCPDPQAFERANYMRTLHSWTPQK
ncbi:dihydroorotate dehydrogenase-like protein [soil metagenome]